MCRISVERRDKVLTNKSRCYYIARVFVLFSRLITVAWCVCVCVCISRRVVCAARQADDDRFGGLWCVLLSAVLRFPLILLSSNIASHEWARQEERVEGSIQEAVNINLSLTVLGQCIHAVRACHTHPLSRFKRASFKYVTTSLFVSVYLFGCRMCLTVALRAYCIAALFRSL